MLGKVSYRVQICAVWLLLVMPGVLLAEPTLFGTPVPLGDYVSSRSVSGVNELTVVTGSASSASVAWTVSYSNGKWDYSYTFTGFGSDMSHVTIDLSDDFAYAGSGVMQDVTATIGSSSSSRTVEYGTLDSIVGAGKVQIPGGNASGFTLSFSSTNAPMWADLYMKGGNFEVANFNYLNHVDDDGKSGYVATPDTTGNPPIVPVPGAFALSTLGAGILMRLRKRRTL